MSFGVSNVGVINQRNAPAIWESALADFPVNFILGRILIDTDNGAIYLDTLTTRILIQAGASGAITYQNGIVETNPTLFSKVVQLGGIATDDMEIDLATNLKSLTFTGATFAQQPSITPIGITVGSDIVPTMQAILGVPTIVANATMRFIDSSTGDIYKVAGQKV